MLAAWPALLAVVLGNEMRRAVSEGGRLIEQAWAPSLGLSLSFNLDGLGLLFAILITGIGAFIVLYASRYLEEPRARRPFLRITVRVHGRDGRRRSQQQHPHAVRVLGAHRVYLVPAHWLRARAGRGAEGRTSGVDRHGRGRPGAARGGGAARRCLWHHEPVRDGGTAGRHRRQPLLWRHRGSGSARGIHEIRAGPVPLLAAERDGGAHTCERISPLRHDGEGRDLPHCQDDPHRRLDARVDGRGDRRGRHDYGCRGLSLRAGNRPQAHPRVPDAECARRAHDAAGSGHARGHYCGAGVSRRACRLQGRVVHGRWGHRSRSGDPRYFCALGSAQDDAHDRARRRRSRDLDGRRAADPRIRRQGRSLRSVASRERLVPRAVDSDRARQHPSRTGGIARRCVAVSRGRTDERGARPPVATVVPPTVPCNDRSPCRDRAINSQRTALSRSNCNGRRAG